MDEIRIGSLGFARLASAADNRIESANLFEETSLVQDDLAYNTLSASLFSTSRAVLDTPYGAAVQFYRNGSLHSTFYKEAVKRTGPNTYSLSAVSRVGLLERMEHRGGIYTGQTAGEVICGICGSVPVQVKSSLEGMKLYGWLPYVKPPDSSARDNLAQVLFAIGASVKTDLHGNLRVEGLWNGMTGTVSRERVYSGGNVEYGEKYTAVSVTEHQYIQGTEEAQLFEGTAQEGDLITFDEPMHSLKATGFSILDSGANYARVSAGTGTLTGKKYIHNTRQVIKALGAAQAENVKAVNDATLVSLVNSDAVANRLAAYYQCEEIIDVPVVAQRETPGDVLQVYHPYDRKMVPACLQSADISLSNTLKAQEKLLVGFVPPKYEQIVTYDQRELLTGSGTWAVPEGVTKVRAVLIEGGHAGENGQAGESNIVTTERWYNQQSYTTPSSGGKSGGIGGTGGLGGKVYEASIEVTPLSQIVYSTGNGSSSADIQPTESIFGAISSESGSSSPLGYTDIITGETYARAGLDGIDGGAGGNYGQQGESVNGNRGGYARSGKDIFLTSSTIKDYFNVSWNGSGGGGASATSVGESGVLFSASASGRISSGHLTGATTIDDEGYGSGGNGGPGKSGENYGDGGGGGHGGGGAGGFGSATVSARSNATMTQGNFAGTWISGGKGGTGGAGGPGCIILYYGIQKVIRSGPIAARDGKFLLDRHGRRIIV